ncbi:hypothetical protein A2313_02465 [Candidatus Roizmanbacteria bacterium RIFOXYB2_FULL_41_10]|nr:MAG: hypothetical protein A2377_01990 [Candidatus Roizmanbacteria bacterium RIFOXYB1_FULL_41_27]OGK68213.1 MAG: hypothetical protein A2262_00040 [Candidatus Roizmanbacteria bacterium RIFOXYA2_FULL_41_8]OGK69226.1 MAG: hypothetical protein A2313_02465 [Candidatus Roizmanbacteria bacterium RIFOXYB2_FULL_41_10]OGK72038.1 MAG: hypothetical protein A2403_03745 [Candidatus Roizmanbacteria bacterium RIFOXYC1_FULL_41_16]OGK74690.1 MAG: hypothetical protein A2575_01200 [Candidatus Roizmanbacteria bac
MFFVITTKNKLIILLSAALFLVCWTVVANTQTIHSSNIILPNIYLDQILVGGLTKEQAIKLLNKRYRQNNQFKIELKFDNKNIATIAAKNLDYQLPIHSAVDQAYIVGRGQGLSALYQQIALKLGWESYNFDLNPIYDQKYLNNLLNELAQSYKKEPLDARFDFADGRVQAFQVEKNGYQLDMASVQTEIEKALKDQRFKPRQVIKVSVAKQILKAEIKLKEINNLGIRELVGMGSSHFAGSAPERVHNIVTGANKINGMIIKPKQTFSFNEFLGEISGRTGFAPAFVIKNGRTVLDDGGGICQVSTTMFRTALNAGVPILERTAHAYRVGYYEQDAKPGLDATIYLPTVDLKFENDYQSALLIQSEVDLNEMKLTFYLYGTKDQRQVELSEITMWNIAPPPEPEYIDDFNLPEGVTKQVDFAAWGTSAKFTYKVLYPNNEVKQQEFVSNFRPWKAIYLVGKKTN